MSLKKILFTTFFLLFQFTVFSQKIEKESRVSEESIPPKALQFVNELRLNNNVKWYKEKTSGRDSYESKFKFNNSFYSVEFDTLGNVEDVEVIVKRRNLSQQEQSKLKERILVEFEKFKWIKIQRQYFGNEEQLKNLFLKKDNSIEHNFEVEIEAKTSDGSWKMYELLINTDGEIVKKREIQLRPTENLNY